MNTTYTELLSNLVGKLASPLYKNSLYLMGGAIVSAGSGFVFWWISARLTTVEDVGLATSIIASIKLIGTWSEMGVSTSLVHYGAKRGKHSYRIVNGLIRVRWMTVSILCLLFLLTIPIFSPGLLPIYQSPIIVIVFAAFAMLDAILAVQDMAMLNLGYGQYVFLRQLACNLPPTIIVLFMYMIVNQADYQILFLSFILPNLLVGTFTSMWILPKYYPNYQFFGQMHWRIIRLLIPYGFTNYLGNQIWGLANLLVPLVAINTINSQVAGIFNISWLVFSAVLIIPRMADTSLFVEGSKSPDDLMQNSIRTIIFTYSLITPLIIFLFIFGDIILAFFGSAYRDPATLQILLLSAFPFVINGNFFTQLRTLDRRRILILFTSVNATVTMSGFVFLPSRYGILGISYAWLIGQVVTSLIPITIILYLYGRRILQKRDCQNTV